MFTCLLIKCKLLMSTWYTVCLNASWFGVDKRALESGDLGLSPKTATQIKYSGLNRLFDSRNVTDL